MPATFDSLFKQLNKVFFVPDMPSGGGSTVVATTAVAAGDTAVTVGSITSFSSGDVIRVGSGETMETVVISGAPSGASIPVAAGFLYAHAIGDPVVEQIAYDLGDIEAGGVDLNVSGQSTDVPVSTQRLAYTTLTGFVSANIQFKLPQLTLPGLAIACGIPQSTIGGAGTTASPYQLQTNGSEFATVVNGTIVAVGVKNDGSFLRAEFYGCSFDYTGISAKLSRGALTPIPVKATAANGCALFSSNYGFTPDTSLSGSSGKVWDALTEVGLMLDTGTSTTTTAAQVAGDTALALTSATGVSAGVWLRIGTGNATQFAWVNGVVSLAATLRTKLYKPVASGATVVVVTPTAFTGTDPDGVTVAIGGQVDTVNIAERRMSIGTRAGAATVTVSFGTIAATLANIAYALGIPQSAISGGKLPVGSNVGTAAINGLYAKGTLKDGTSCMVLAAGCNVDASQFKVTINNAGKPVPVPVSAKPTSYVAFYQYP